MSDNPYQSVTPEPSEGASVGHDTMEAAKSRVAGPAIALMVSGALSVAFGLWGLLTAILDMAGIYPTAEQKAEMQRQFDELPPDMEWVRGFSESMTGFQGSPLNLLLQLLGIGLAVLVIVGGLRMKALRSRGLAMAAAVVNLIPVLTCCCWAFPSAFGH